MHSELPVSWVLVPAGHCTQAVCPARGWYMLTCDTAKVALMINQQWNVTHLHTCMQPLDQAAQLAEAWQLVGRTPQGRQVLPLAGLVVSVPPVLSGL